jgi:hypothetical protein
MAKPRMGRFKLPALIGNRYRLTLEESWFHEMAPDKEANRLYYEQVICLGGAFFGIFTIDPLLFTLWTPRPRNAANIWEAIKHFPGATAQFLDGEVVLKFPKEAVHIVAEIAGARKKRQYTEAQKTASIERVKDYQFKTGETRHPDAKTAPISHAKQKAVGE